MNIPITQFALHTANEFTSCKASLSLPLWAIIRCFNFAHRSFFWCTRLVRYSKPENFAPLAAGVGLQLFFGNNEVVKFAARVLDVALRILECSEDLNRIKKTWKKLSDAFFGREVFWVKQDWKKINGQSFLIADPLRFSIKVKRFFHILTLIRELFISLILDVFYLSMGLMNVKKAYDGHFLQVVEAPLNFVELAQKRKIVDTVLKAMGVQWDVKRFLEEERKSNILTDLQSPRVKKPSHLRLLAKEELLKNPLKKPEKNFIHQKDPYFIPRLFNNADLLNYIFNAKLNLAFTPRCLEPDQLTPEQIRMLPIR